MNKYYPYHLRVQIKIHLIGFSLRLPGSKTKLLEQKIPATYLALEDVVGGIAAELRSGGNDPVLNQVNI